MVAPASSFFITRLSSKLDFPSRIFDTEAYPYPLLGIFRATGRSLTASHYSFIFYFSAFRIAMSSAQSPNVFFSEGIGELADFSCAEGSWGGNRVGTNRSIGLESFGRARTVPALWGWRAFFLLLGDLLVTASSSGSSISPPLGFCGAPSPLISSGATTPARCLSDISRLKAAPALPVWALISRFILVLLYCEPSMLSSPPLLWLSRSFGSSSKIRTSRYLSAWVSSRRSACPCWTETSAKLAADCPWSA